MGRGVIFLQSQHIDMAAPSPALDPHPGFSEIQKNLKLLVAEIFDELEDYTMWRNARFGLKSTDYSIDETIEGFQHEILDKLAELESRHYTTIFKDLIDYVSPLISYSNKKDINVFFVFLNIIKPKMTDE